MVFFRLSAEKGACGAPVRAYDWLSLLARSTSRPNSRLFVRDQLQASLDLNARPPECVFECEIRQERQVERVRRA